MSFQWPVDAEDLFGERYPQMVNTGLPAPDVDAVRAAITQMWTDAPGGWVYEWSALAARYASEGSHQLAALAYGWAKFPTLADDSKRGALQNQLEQYLLAAPDFGVDFQRRVLDVPYRGASTPVPVHIFAAPDLPAHAPVLLASGGVDSWKMDMHNMFVLAAATAGVRVVAFDIAGTGESVVPMTPDGGAEIVRGLVAEARTLGNGIVIHLGISMGGHYSARSGLAGEVDAAMVLGGPVEDAFNKDISTVQFGMDGIIATPWDSTSAPVPKNWPRHSAPSRCVRCSIRTPTPRCWWLTAPTMCTYPSTTPWSSRAAATLRSTSSLTPGTARPRNCPKRSA
jgi:esterase FrsA